MEIVNSMGPITLRQCNPHRCPFTSLTVASVSHGSTCMAHLLNVIETQSLSSFTNYTGWRHLSRSSSSLSLGHDIIFIPVVRQHWLHATRLEWSATALHVSTFAITIQQLPEDKSLQVLLSLTSFFQFSCSACTATVSNFGHINCFFYLLTYLSRFHIIR